MNFSNKGWRARGTGQIAGHVASLFRTTNFLLLREDLVELLRRFRAAADINRILGLEVKVSAELHQQIFAALDGDDGAAGLDANIGLARMEFFQAASRDFDHAQLVWVLGSDTTILSRAVRRSGRFVLDRAREKGLGRDLAPEWFVQTLLP